MGSAGLRRGGAAAGARSCEAGVESRGVRGLRQGAVRAWKCSMLFLFTCGERSTQYSRRFVGSGT